MAIKRVNLLQKRRVLRSREDNVPLRKADIPVEPVYSVATRRIMEMPYFPKILEHLKAGITVPAIVSWFDGEGWLGTLSPSTFTQYLYKFKSERHDLLSHNLVDKESYDFYVGASIPTVDPEKEMDKLIMAQKRRVSLDMSTEVGIGKLLDTTVKEVKVLGELLAIRANMNGTGHATAINGDVGTTLRNLRVNEGEQDKMQELTEDLFASMKNAHKAKKTVKVGKSRG